MKIVQTHSSQKDFFSDKYLEIASCGLCADMTTRIVSENRHGRQDYHLLYLVDGTMFFELGGKRVLAERLIEPIRELECAYFSAQGEEFVSRPGEILCDGFYSYGRKYSEGAAEGVCRAELPARITERIREWAMELCRFIGVRHLARVDFFLSGDDLYFNEINTMPGMTERSLYLRLLESEGIPPAEAINRMISDAMAEGAR